MPSFDAGNAPADMTGWFYGDITKFDGQARVMTAIMQSTTESSNFFGRAVTALSTPAAATPNDAVYGTTGGTGNFIGILGGRNYQSAAQIYGTSTTLGLQNYINNGKLVTLVRREAGIFVGLQNGDITGGAAPQVGDSVYYKNSTDANAGILASLPKGTAAPSGWVLIDGAAVLSPGLTLPTAGNAVGAEISL